MERHMVRPGMAANLAERDPRDTGGIDKATGSKAIKELNVELEHLQELLYAEGTHKLLVVLQAMDTGGKDGTIRHVFDGTNPQGVRVASFKKPTPDELAHDYLWRVHQNTPGSGQIVVFNRSHYEDVLVVRVHNLVSPERWRKRYDHINDFERRLVDEGTTILKFFLHISKDEQKERLQARLDEPEKRWKFAKGDLAERKFWDDYQSAYEEALTRTSTDWAPWYAIPADRKWYRNLAISQIIVKHLRDLNMKYPQPEDELDGIIVE